MKHIRHVVASDRATRNAVVTVECRNSSSSRIRCSSLCWSRMLLSSIAVIASLPASLADQDVLQLGAETLQATTGRWRCRGGYDTAMKTVSALFYTTSVCLAVA